MNAFSTPRPVAAMRDVFPLLRAQFFGQHIARAALHTHTTFLQLIPRGVTAQPHNYM